MNIDGVDLNLLKVFSAVYESRSVSRAAERLELSQPAVSNALARLRRLLGDALFARAHGGVRPTPVADQLAANIKAALTMIEAALGESESFDPARTRRVFRMHMSDIGEARFLPDLMTALDLRAKGVKIESQALPHARLASMLDSGELDFAFGFLPTIGSTEHMPLLRDRYVVLLRAGHPLAGRSSRQLHASAALAQLDFVTVRSHSETLLIVEALGLQERIRLYASHFLALPTIVRATDLGVVMPSHIARGFAAGGGYSVIDPHLPWRDFTVDLHWGKRQQSDPAHRWMRELVGELFRER